MKHDDPNANWQKRWGGGSSNSGRIGGKGAMTKRGRLNANATRRPTAQGGDIVAAAAKRDKERFALEPRNVIRYVSRARPAAEIVEVR
jgi:hypothetical protein